MRWILPLLLAGCSVADGRARHLEHLRQYIEAGRFPVNEDIEEETPIFVDRRGVPCAVAYLMLKAGREDLVRQVVETDNYVRIGELHEGPVLDWIRASGLTQEECARIQPAYRKRRWWSYAFRPLGVQGGRQISGEWVIPAEFLQRPHLSEPIRVYSHLRQVESFLSRRSAFIPPPWRKRVRTPETAKRSFPIPGWSPFRPPPSPRNGGLSSSAAMRGHVV